MIYTEENEYHTQCDNCTVRPKRLVMVVGKRSLKEDGDQYVITLCSRCVRRMGKEMVAWKDES